MLYALADIAWSLLVFSLLLLIEFSRFGVNMSVDEHLLFPLLVMPTYARSIEIGEVCYITRGRRNGTHVVTERSQVDTSDVLFVQGPIQSNVWWQLIHQLL